MSMIETLPAPRLTVGAVRLARNLRRAGRMIRIGLHVVVGLVVLQLPRGRAASSTRRAAVRWWARTLCRLLHLELRVHGPLPQRHSLLVTNHISWLDIPALLSVVDADFVAKRDVAGWPMIGDLAARVGTIFLARGQRNAARETADGMTWRLAQRRHVILFPEATTSDGRGVRRFYARLYQAAVRTHSPIQAVALRYPGLDGPQGAAPFIADDELLSHLWRLLGEKRLVAELHFCDPILPNADRRTLANRTRHQICAALGIASELTRPLSAKLRFPRQRAA